MVSREGKIGLEIHIYPRIRNGMKLFCDCPIIPPTLDAEPNTAICEVCTAQPGAKPMLPNREAILKTLAVALIFKSRLVGKAFFQRKHYDWPDLPAGYQRTMSGSYASPIATGGEYRGVRIRQVHLEEDPARWDPETGRVDYNRSGTPLIEIVTEPDFTSAEQVEEWLRDLRRDLLYADAYDERYSSKADVNVSTPPDYTRVELKNINSFSMISEAIRHELARQYALKEKGEKIIRETRAWTGSGSVRMRGKEEAVDYRFIPEVDLPGVPIQPLLAEAEALLAFTPERASEALRDAGVTEEDRQILLDHPITAKLTLKLIEEGIPGETAGRIVRREFLRVVNYHHALPEEYRGIDAFPLLVKRWREGVISDGVFKRLVERLYDEPLDIDRVIREEGLGQVSDEETLRKLVREVIGEHADAVASYRQGEGKAINYLIGQVMRKTKGRADSRRVRDLLEEALREE